jgi:hypothetical protein
MLLIPLFLRLAPPLSGRKATKGRGERRPFAAFVTISFRIPWRASDPGIEELSQ